MQVVQGEVLISPSDITSAAQCEFAWLRNLDLRLGRIENLPEATDPMTERAAGLGTLHERRQLEVYRSRLGPDGVVTIESPGSDVSRLAAACARTLQALQEGIPVVYQAAVRDANLRGFADFLVMHDDKHYVVEDTKLARTAKVPALVQIAAYADILAAQGVPVADHGRLILGNGKESVHDLSTVIPVYRARRAALKALLEWHVASDEAVDWGNPAVSACGRCAVCEEAAMASRDVLIVAGVRMTQRDRLRGAGFATIDALANGASDVSGIPAATLKRLRLQAQLQIRAESDAALPHSVIGTAPLAALPSPSPGDIFFDFEGDPMWQDPNDLSWGLEYLFGVVEADTGRFEDFWADDRTAERAALRAFLDYVRERRTRWPEMHIYHYASYERVALLRLAGQFGEGEDEVDDLLRANVLVDLYPIVRGSIVVGARSYGLKALEPLFLQHGREGAVTTAGDSVVEYVSYCLERERGDEAAAEVVRQAILDYNEQDCRSTLSLRNWLLHSAPNQNSDATTDSGEEARTGTRAADEAALAEPLWEWANRDSERDATESAFALLAAAVGYHRRESKPFWWDHFDRLKNPPDTWANTSDVLVIQDCEVEQDWHKSGRKNPRRLLRARGVLQAGSCLERETNAYLLYDSPAPPGMSDAPVHYRGHTSATVQLLLQNAQTATFQIEETLPSQCDQFRALPMAAAPQPGPNATPLQDAIAGVAKQVAETRELPSPLANLLLRQPPRASLPPVVDDDFIGAITEATRSLDGTTLAVQGPPGTGKTYTAAHVIAQLVEHDGWRIGVVSQGHSAVNHLLDRSVDAGIDPSQVGKKSKPDDSRWTDVPTRQAASFLADHETEGCVYGGTAWDFASPRVEQGLLDLLVIDEAGQFSLANTIAVARSALRMLLLGDPQQLPQVAQGTHPEPVDGSALGWLAQGAVLEPDYGYFLAVTRRMHPKLCEAVSIHSYAGQLVAHPCTEERRLSHGDHEVEPGVISDLLEHSGNSVSSPEEAHRIAELAKEALGWTWRPTGDTPPRPVNATDILIVAPYNAQVELIRTELERQNLHGFRIGTVDKFQGQEAPIVLVSMTASSHDDVPRGMEFLLSPNRINVALSRAQWRTTIVHSNRLTDYLPSRLERLSDLGRFMRLTTPR